jgi:spore coat protein A
MAPSPPSAPAQPRQSRRQFLKLAVASGFGLAFKGLLPEPSLAEWQPARPTRAFICSLGTRAAVAQAGTSPQAIGAAPSLALFAQPLRGVGPGNIPVAATDGLRFWKGGDVVAQHYTIDINQYTDRLHPDLPPTTLWGYHSRKNLGGDPAQRHLGGLIVARRGQPIQLTFQNNLPAAHILPVDTTLMGAEGAPNRAAVHLHGGAVPWISDGGPLTWFDPQGGYGDSIQPAAGANFYKLLNPQLQPGQAEYYYPLEQSARMLWYHDHAIGTTRLNAYAGIASALIVRDAFEQRLVRQLGLPDFVERGGRELPIVIQDKLFSGAGDLAYPSVYAPEDRLGDPDILEPLPETSVVPEMFGDTMLANGTVYPRAAIAGARYRLRILNACQSRFLNLQLYVADASGLAPDFGQPGPDFLVIGTEGGFLSRPAVVPSGRQFAAAQRADQSWDFQGSLITGPAERWDVVADFSSYAGKRLILYNDAPAPFPNGDPAADYSTPGSAPNTRVIMCFDVGAALAEPPMRINASTRLALDPDSGVDRFLAPFAPPSASLRVRRRQLTLNEANDAHGRLIQMLGTNQPNALPWPIDADTFGNVNYGRQFMDAPTETPRAGTAEIWEIANLTGDTHPIHFHLVNVQLLARRPFDVASYSGTPSYTGPARGPNPTELGWKDTVQMHPGEVTTVIMRFDLPRAPFKVPLSPSSGGHDFVWHCHILEHEEHDMMRPLIVMP